MSQREDSTRTATDPAASVARLPATLRLGAVHLTVSDLDSSVASYRDAIGLRLHRREKWWRLGLKVMADHPEGGVRPESTGGWERGIHTPMRGSLERGAVSGRIPPAVIPELRTR